MTSSSEESAASSPTPEECRRYAATNDKFLRLINLATSLEFANGRHFFRSELLSALLGIFRLAMCVQVFVRLVLAYTLSDCDSSALRFLILDWTVVYPYAYRVKLLRVMMSIELALLILRSRVLFGGNHDTTFQDFLSRVPAPLQSPEREFAAAELLWARELPQSTSEVELLSSLQPGLDRERASGSLGHVGRLSIRAPRTSRFGRPADRELADVGLAATRDRDHWLVLSASIDRRLRRATAAYWAPCALTVPIVSLRVLFLLGGARDCDSITFPLRVFGTGELLMSLSEIYFAVYGVAAYVWLAMVDLVALAEASERRLELLVGSRGARKPAPSHLCERRAGAARLAVVRLLRALDGHKRSINFIGNFLYSWLLLSLSLVPLIIDHDRTPVRGVHVFMLTCAVASCLAFSFACGHVHQRALAVGRLIFRLSCQTQERAERRFWNKVLLFWYNPNRCAFRVGNTLDLTYANIMNSTSFLLSGLVLMLNYGG